MVTAKGKKALGQSKFKGKQFDPTTGKPTDKLPEKKKFNIVDSEGQREVSREEFKEHTAKQEAEAEGDRIVREGGKEVISAEEFAGKQELIKAIGSEVIPTAPEEQPTERKKLSPFQLPSLPEPVLSGLGSASQAGGAAGGAAVGAAVGSVVPGVGTVIGAVVGAGVGAFIKGFTSELKENAEENIQVQADTLIKETKNLRLLIVDAKTDPERALNAFNDRLNAIDFARSNLKKESQKDLNKFLSADTRTQMADFDRFYSPGGLRDIYVSRMQAVFLNPRSDVSDLLYPSDFEQSQ